MFIIAVTAFGGPQAHLAMMLQRFVHKRKYLSEEELMELNALCQMLPGPGSTQTLMAIALKLGGRLLAVITLFVWVVPSLILMSLLVIGFNFLDKRDFDPKHYRFIQPMAIGFIAFAGFRIGTTVLKSNAGMALMVLACVVSILIHSPWVFPAVLVFAGIASNFFNKSRGEIFHGDEPLRWKMSMYNIALFFSVFILAGVCSIVFKYRPVVLFENFYRFASLTFGGGQVLVPMMYEQFVKHRHYISGSEFVSGYVMAQAIPGPAFSFAAFTGGMALRDLGANMQLLGCLIGTVAIFLPGVFFIFFIYPFWNYLKSYRVVKRSLEGINAAATGLVLSAAVLLYKELQPDWMNIVVCVSTFCLLNFTRIPGPVLVVVAVLLGVFL